jgi:hypothetical protein
MLIRVRDAAESITFADVEVVESVRFGESVRGSERRGAAAWRVRWGWCSFGPAGSNPALHDRVHARHADTGLEDDDAFVFDGVVEHPGVPAVVVPDQRSARPFRAGHLCVVAAEHIAVPTQDRIGGDDQVQLSKLRPWESLQEGSEEGPIGPG